MVSKAAGVILRLRWLLVGTSRTWVAEEPVWGGTAVLLCREVSAGGECVVRLMIFMGGCSSV